MSEDIEKLKKSILEDYPRMDENSTFSFKCHPGVSCFNDCCADVNIFLTPYDIIRLKNRLGISSGEFLSKYTISPFDKNAKYPIILFKMQDDEKKRCQLVSDSGCTVYEDRPWACRMYPLGMASPKEGGDESDKEFYFLLKEAGCQGHEEKNEMTVAEWIADQGIAEYNRMGEFWKDITLHSFFQNPETQLSPQKIEMFFTACYNIDRFRDFVFKSSFLDKFEVEPDVVEKMKDDDVEMLMFAYRWIRFSLFGEPTLKIKDDIEAAKKKELEQKAREKEK